MNILLYVEDPGAANGLMHLPAKFIQHGHDAILLASGHACVYLKSHNISFVDITHISCPLVIIERYNPDRILVGTSENTNSIGLQLIAAGKDKGIKTIAYVDSCAMAEFRFKGSSNNALMYLPDHILAADQSVVTNFIQLGVSPSLITLVGNPYYGYVQEVYNSLSLQNLALQRKKLFGDAAQDKAVVVFLSEISNGLGTQEYCKTVDYTLHGRGSSNLRTHIVLEELLDSLSLLPIQPWIVLKLHPKDTINVYKNYLTELDQIITSQSALQVVFCADLVVGMTTSLLLESALMRKPVLSVLPRRAEQSWLPEWFNQQKNLFAFERDTLHKQIVNFFNRAYNLLSTVDVLDAKNNIVQSVIY